MKTASFFTYQGAGRVSIARFPPRGTPAGFRVYKRLAPGEWFNSVTRDEYERRFAAQLAELDAAAVKADLERLAGDDEPVLLCYERPPFTEKNWCHRRLVARWFLETLGLRVPELVTREQLENAVFRHQLVAGKWTDDAANERAELSKLTDDELVEMLPREVAQSLGLR
jgi:hypothetical protein